jgi:hypothetical protein
MEKSVFSFQCDDDAARYPGFLRSFVAIRVFRILDFITYLRWCFWCTIRILRTANTVNTISPQMIMPGNITFPSPDPTLPSSELLALHATCAKVARLSGAGEYIDLVLEAMEQAGVSAHDYSSSNILYHAILAATQWSLVRRISCWLFYPYVIDIHWTCRNPTIKSFRPEDGRWLANLTCYHISSRQLRFWWLDLLTTLSNLENIIVRIPYLTGICFHHRQKPSFWGRSSFAVLILDLCSASFKFVVAWWISKLLLSSILIFCVQICPAI